MPNHVFHLEVDKARNASCSWVKDLQRNVFHAWKVASSVDRRRRARISTISHRTSAPPSLWKMAPRDLPTSESGPKTSGVSAGCRQPSSAKLLAQSSLLRNSDQSQPGFSEGRIWTARTDPTSGTSMCQPSVVKKSCFRRRYSTAVRSIGDHGDNPWTLFGPQRTDSSSNVTFTGITWL